MAEITDQNDRSADGDETLLRRNHSLSLHSVFRFCDRFLPLFQVGRGNRLTPAVMASLILDGCRACEKTVW